MIRRSGSLRAPDIGFPIEIGADIGALFAAVLAGEPRLQVGQPDVIRPTVRVHGRPVAARVDGGSEQVPATTRGALLGEGDFVARRHWQAPRSPPIWPDVKPLGVGVHFRGYTR